MFDVCLQQLSNSCQHTHIILHYQWERGGGWGGTYFDRFFGGNIFERQAHTAMPCLFIVLFRCLVNGGRAVLEEYLAEQESLLFCMMEQFDLQVS